MCEQSDEPLCLLPWRKADASFSHRLMYNSYLIPSALRIIARYGWSQGEKALRALVRRDIVVTAPIRSYTIRIRSLSYLHNSDYQYESISPVQSIPTHIAFSVLCEAICLIALVLYDASMVIQEKCMQFNVITTLLTMKLTVCNSPLLRSSSFTLLSKLKCHTMCYTHTLCTHHQYNMNAYIGPSLTLLCSLSFEQYKTYRLPLRKKSERIYVAY